MQILVTPNQFENEQRKVTLKETFIKEQKQLRTKEKQMQH